MDTEPSNGRPNIRIQINNPPNESMEVDDSEEEGEISDVAPNKQTIKPADPIAMILDTFKDFDPSKLEERAKRFSLKPDEVSPFTEQDLQLLYASLGVNSTNAHETRFEAVHVRTSNNIGVENVVNYFADYFPVSVEFVDNESFNLVWEDKLSSARAVFHTSQSVKDMPVRNVEEHMVDESEDGDLNLFSKNRQIELRDDTANEPKNHLNNSADISEINIPIPPGYWRLGKKRINTFSILMRFSQITDKKPVYIEKCSKYIISKKIDKEYRGIFARNKEINKKVPEKNPWGILAKTWDEDAMFREKIYKKTPIEEELPKTLPINPELRVRLEAKRRLGRKPQESATENEVSEEENKTKLKMPRMKMYADEEEEKIRRKRLLQTLKKQTDKLKETEIPNSDLRNVLRMTNKKQYLSDHKESEDLSMNLMNRKRKLVFTVAQEMNNRQPDMRHRLDKSRTSNEYSRKREPVEVDRHEHNHRSSRRHRGRRRSSDSDYSGKMYSSRNNDNLSNQKPRSKVALVIKTHKKPSVASTVQSRKHKPQSSSSEETSSESDSESESSDGSSSSTMHSSFRKTHVKTEDYRRK